MKHWFTSTDLAAQKAMDHLAKGGFDSLSDIEKTLATAWLFEAGVTNSGFSRYYSGRRGDLAFHAPVALRTIGATQLAEIAAEANAVFGDAGPPADRAERRSLLRALPASARARFVALERRFYECPEDIDALLEGFLARQHATA